MDFLSLKNISYRNGSTEILKELNIDFQRGQFYVIVGPNGSGKTTLLKTIIKNIIPSKGIIELEGKNLKNIKAKHLASRFSYVPQNTNIELEFTCYDLVMMARNHKLKTFQSEGKVDEDIVINAMRKMEVLHLKDKPITEISGGEKQRVILARAIAQETSYIILDEPISNLDIKHQILVMEHLKKLREEGKTIITVLHDLNFALNYGDYGILVSKGSVFSQGKIENVITPKTIKEVYEVESEIIKKNNKSFVIY
ncbi:ABC transporter ATP-binding protein [Clostridium botulinum]|uniref:ABC transporter ATP-binding protein n=2 Tax=Clostridium botulinum TaxID=1491 RepID=UPI0009475FDE|nr:ABC transporter ATP-binding protein [Clostridium botulinum]APQ77869.1 ABC transporter family protein [Clostridium botulinum]AUM98811.1 iron ABC transporter ATP-binding protein [Clostridium botulinum]MBN3353189.1 ABC transporter ATP-binding protein [Clostridium botulinum]MBY6799173.1 ABC transporter ATP-binding protein [Clostridium botulinum]MCC5438621.1 ABC transporter ATP-binding protein [Clostridium botulinum]